MFSAKNLFLNGPIPGSKKLFTRLTSQIPPIEPDPAAVMESKEIHCAGFRTSGSEFPQVKSALKLLKDSLKKFTGPALPLEIIIDSPEGKNRDHEIRITEKKVTINARTPFGASRALYRLRSRFALRKAPFLKTGFWDSKNTLDPILGDFGLINCAGNCFNSA